MGFRLQKNHARLQFEGRYEGAEVVLNLSTKLGTYLDMAKAKELGQMDVVFDFLGETLLEWNLEDDNGNPLPVGIEGIRALDDLGFLAELLAQWEKAMSGQAEIDPLLARHSTNGSTSG